MQQLVRIICVSCMVLATAAPAQAQWEASLGVGVNRHQALRNGPSAAGTLESRPGYAPQLLLGVGFRQNSRWTYRGNFEVANYSFTENFASEPLYTLATYSTDYFTFSGEAAYFPVSWLSVALGAGYSSVSESLSLSPSPSTPRGPFVHPFSPPKSYLMGHGAIELYAGDFSLRVSPRFGLTQGFDDVTLTDINGEELGSVGGRWNSTSASLVYRYAFGKNRRTQAIPTLDERLDALGSKLLVREPRLALGVRASMGSTHPVGGRNDSLSTIDLCLSMEAVGRYTLGDRLTLTGGLGYRRQSISPRWMPTAIPDTINNFDYQAARWVFHNLELGAGAEYRFLGDFALELQLRPWLALGQETRPRIDYFPTYEEGEDIEAPQARAGLNARANLSYQVGARVRFEAGVDYSLTRPYGNGLDERLDPPRARTERWVTPYVGMSYMLVRGDGRVPKSGRGKRARE